MNWKKLTALALLFPVYLWLVGGLLTPAKAVEFAEHMAEEGEHYEPYGYHVSPQVEKPQVANFLDVVTSDRLLSPPVFLEHPLAHLVRDHPPPLFYSLSHSLRAPPTLIPA